MILLMDDDKLGIKAFRDEIHYRGFEVEQFINPDGFCEFVQQNHEHIQCIIMDIMLPTGKNLSKEDTGRGIRAGLELLKHLKSSDKLKKIPILILTIVDDQDVYDWASEHSVEVCVKYNVTPMELADKVIKLVGTPK